MNKQQASYALAGAGDSLDEVIGWAEDLEDMPELLLQTLDEAAYALGRARRLLLELEG